MSTTPMVTIQKGEEKIRIAAAALAQHVRLGWKALETDIPGLTIIAGEEAPKPAPVPPVEPPAPPAEPPAAPKAATTKGA